MIEMAVVHTCAVRRPVAYVKSERIRALTFLFALAKSTDYIVQTYFPIDNETAQSQALGSITINYVDVHFLMKTAPPSQTSHPTIAPHRP